MIQTIKFPRNGALPIVYVQGYNTRGAPLGTVQVTNTALRVAYSSSVDCEEFGAGVEAWFKSANELAGLIAGTALALEAALGAGVATVVTSGGAATPAAPAVSGATAIAVLAAAIPVFAYVATTFSVPFVGWVATKSCAELQPPDIGTPTPSSFRPPIDGGPGRFQTWVCAEASEGYSSGSIETEADGSDTVVVTWVPSKCTKWVLVDL